MDDFNGEVSCTEVLGIETGEQALTYGFPLPVAGCAESHFLSACVSRPYTSTVLL